MMCQIRPNNLNKNIKYFIELFVSPVDSQTQTCFEVLKIAIKRTRENHRIKRPTYKYVKKVDAT